MLDASHLLQEVFISQAETHNHNRILFINEPRQSGLVSYHYQAYQPFKSFLNQEVTHLQSLESGIGSYDIVLIVGTKNVKETQYYMACGFKVLKKRGNLFIAADNKENGKRLQKWLEALDLHPLMHAGHKAKCASVCVNDQVNGDLLRDWYDAGAVKKNDNGLYAQAGLFSYETGDTASQLLIETINEPLFGSVADFGCGYGFLSVKAAEKNPALSSLHGFDADQRALDCYEMNLEETNKVAQSYWVDLGEDYRHSETFDFILMNPPFHAGRRELPTLGISFIRNASKNLKDRGVLWMVANTHLPYENILKEHFSDFKMITQQQGFKVIRAVK